MVGLILVSNTVHHYFQEQLAHWDSQTCPVKLCQCRSKLQPEPGPEAEVSSWLSNIVLHLQPIWLHTLVVIYSESCQRLFLNFCMQPSAIAVLFNWNLCRGSFLKRLSYKICWFALDWIRSKLLCSNALFLLEDQKMIQTLSEAMSTTLVGDRFLTISSKNSFQMRKNSNLSSNSGKGTTLLLEFRGLTDQLNINTYWDFIIFLVV